jgi:hypothetical protein
MMADREGLFVLKDYLYREALQYFVYHHPIHSGTNACFRKLARLPLSAY